MKNKVENEQLNILAVSGWLLFKEFMPELNQKIEIYWSTDEITKQIWRNDIPWTSNELPRFWRACLQRRIYAILRYTTSPAPSRSGRHGMRSGLPKPPGCLSGAS